MNKSIVYWLVGRTYDMPESAGWINDMRINPDGTAAGFKSSVDAVTERIVRDRPVSYAVVTDGDDIEFRMLNDRVISNNVVRIRGTYDKAKTACQLEWILSNFGSDAKQPKDGVFVTSDTHFSHRNIIKYCNRPWNSGKGPDGEIVVTDEDLARMDDELIENWNSTVGKNSIVWHLGDFCLGPNQAERIPELVSKLNGRINLVIGNHDRHPVEFYYKAGFNRVYDRPVVVSNFCILSHAPMPFVRAPFMNCFGHVHGCPTYRTWSPDSCCACVERHDYRPIPMSLIESKWRELNSESAI